MLFKMLSPHKPFDGFLQSGRTLQEAVLDEVLIKVGSFPQDGGFELLL